MGTGAERDAGGRAGEKCQTGSPRKAAAPGVRRRVTGKRRPAAPPGRTAEPPAWGAPGCSLRALVINLDRRADRWSNFKRRFSKLQASGFLRTERLAATDGQAGVSGDAVGSHWTTDRNARYDGRKGYRPGVALSMTPGERGCAMSHVRAWREVAEGGGELPVLILEDDAVPAKLFSKRAAAALAAAPPDTDALYLGYIQGARWRGTVAPGLHEAEYLWTTVGYVLWPRGARKLLAALPVDEPVDNFMAWQMSTRRFRALAVAPALVEQELEWDCGSDVPHSDDVVLDL